MSIFSIIAISLASLCIAIGIVFLVNIRSFVSYDPDRDHKKQFNRCVNAPLIASLVEFLLFFASLIMVFVECAMDGRLNNTDSIWAPCLGLGLALGFLIGVLYWKKVKEPFLIKSFPEEYKAYQNENKNNRWGRNYYYEEGFVGQFIWVLSSLGLLLGILLAYFL